MAEEVLEIVNEHNQVIGQAARSEIHQRQLRHRSVHVFLFNSRGELFLQKRARTKDEFPGCYDSSAAGHVSPGESYLAAAQRELKEELGIKAALQTIAEISASQETGWEFVTFYSAVSDMHVNPSPIEIDGGDFYPLQEINTCMVREKNKFTPSFKKLFHIYQDKHKIKNILVAKI